MAIDQIAILRFLARNRSRISANKNYATRGDPLSSSVYSFYVYNKNILSKLGISNIIIRTKAGSSHIYYSLTDAGGHIPKDISDLGKYDNFDPVKSRSMHIGDSTSKNDEHQQKAQVLAFIGDCSDSDRKAVKALCDYLVAEFTSSRKEIIIRSIERGTSDIHALYQRAKLDDIQPGTFAIKLSQILARSLGAKICSIAVPFSGSLFLEYATTNLPHKRGRPFIIGGFQIPITDVNEYKNVIYNIDGKSFYDVPRTQEAHKLIVDGILNTTGMLIDKNDRLVMVPVVYDADTIASIILVFDATSRGVLNAGSGLLNRTTRDFAPYARYLHQRRARTMIVDPIFRSRETRIRRGTCFIIMPFGEIWSDHVAKIVKDVLADEGISAIRADEMHGENIMEDVWNAIVTSEYMVADVTGKNPNVYYELGIGHTLGKKILLLTQSTSDIPFDTRHLRHVVYSNDISGFDSIRKGLSGFLTR